MKDSSIVYSEGRRVFSTRAGYEVCGQFAVMLLILFNAYRMAGRVYDVQIITAAIWLAPAFLLGGVAYYAFWYLRGHGNDDSVVKRYVGFSQRYIAAGTVLFCVISSLKIK